MKFVYLILIAAIIIVWGIYFLKRNHRTFTDNSKTEVAVANKIINNGISNYNRPVIANFEINNVGGQPLVIHDVKTDCNCTVPNWDHNPILPHKTTNIKLVYNGSSVGYFQKKAMVYCNTYDSPILLVLRGKIEN